MVILITLFREILEKIIEKSRESSKYLLGIYKILKIKIQTVRNHIITENT
jgi:hypothetical protein